MPDVASAEQASPGRRAAPGRAETVDQVPAGVAQDVLHARGEPRGQPGQGPGWDASAEEQHEQDQANAHGGGEAEGACLDGGVERDQGQGQQDEGEHDEAVEDGLHDEAAAHGRAAERGAAAEHVDPRGEPGFDGQDVIGQGGDGEGVKGRPDPAIVEVGEEEAPAQGADRMGGQVGADGGEGEGQIGTAERLRDLAEVLLGDEDGQRAQGEGQQEPEAAGTERGADGHGKSSSETLRGCRGNP